MKISLTLHAVLRSDAANGAETVNVLSRTGRYAAGGARVAATDYSCGL